MPIDVLCLIGLYDSIQFLLSLQKKLHSLSLESGSLDSEITQRKELLHKIEAEDRIVTKVMYGDK